MKEVCSYANSSILNSDHDILKCIHSNEHYTIEQYRWGRSLYFGVDHICKNDPLFYQACGSPAKYDPLFYQACGSPAKSLMAIENKVLCAGYVCDIGDTNVYVAFGKPGWSVEQCNSKPDCENTLLDEVGCSAEQYICDSICDNTEFTYVVPCMDESSCNGFTYNGMYCSDRNTHDVRFLPGSMICDGNVDCVNGTDEQFCGIDDGARNCTNHAGRMDDQLTITNYTIDVPLSFTQYYMGSLAA